ncbi:MAG: CDP-6-deoxy-delta-3,4-glucoseen reductase [Rhodocyclales bacterium]|nr:CDP-6-deoxy-delta-3,4-glucoseen reductase [Rhodocyclales bacterium]
MAHNVTLQPSGHTDAVPIDTNLLQAALDAGLTLPYGCRNGACGACKGKVTAGQVDHGKAEPHVLTTEDRANGYTLTCCATPLSDVVLEVHEVSSQKDIPVKTMPCRVHELRMAAEDVMVMKLKLPTNERLQFFEGPLGTFRLREESNKPMVMIAGGTGFAPIKALIEHAIHNHIKRPIALYWGAKNRAELYLPELPQQWAAAHPHISYVPVLSEPTAADAWTGRTGFVHEAVLEDFADLSGHQAYVCGAPVMVEAALRDFVARGLPADEFFADIFSYAAKAEKK